MVLDYGHGLITNKIARYVSGNSKYLLNTQLNASNFSQRIDKFNKSDCVIINESELRNFIKETDIKLNNIVKSHKINKNKKSDCYSWKKRCLYIQ